MNFKYLIREKSNFLHKIKNFVDQWRPSVHFNQ